MDNNVLIIYLRFFFLTYLCVWVMCVLITSKSYLFSDITVAPVVRFKELIEELFTYIILLHIFTYIV